MKDGKWNIYHRRVLVTVCLFIIVCCMAYTKYDEGKQVMLPVCQKIVVLDAGHGGWDPGKTGNQGKNEQELNLAITKKLAQFLEQGGATVYMTRVDEEALGTKKGEDMKERQTVANESGGDIFVSIHQNAFSSHKVKGAQVFYHKNSEKGKYLAEEIQNSLKQHLNEENTRMAKPNGDYYVLRTTKIPAALVECGFLSNKEEEQLLNDETYQERVAWAIYCGILSYFSAGEGAI